MAPTNSSIEFTGEFLVPGQSGNRIEADHLARYEFAGKFAKSKRILDVACGFGYAGPLLIARGGASYDGMDINANLVANAQATYGTNKITYHLGDITSFDFDKQYDLITCFETIEHIRNYKAALHNLRRHLQPHGVLLVSSPNRPITSPNSSSLTDAPANKFHTQEFTPRELITTLRMCGYTVDESQVWGQRKRYSNAARRLIARVFRGNPDETASPAPTLTEAGSVPRYFLLVAQRSPCTQATP